MPRGEVDGNIEKFISQVNKIGKSVEMQMSAASMKTCMVQLAHKTRINFKTSCYEHKLLVILCLEGEQEKIELMKWYL